MNTSVIKYKAGYKYQLQMHVCVEGMTQLSNRHWQKYAQFLYLLGDKLYINKGYAWDGPSGGCPDFKSFMKPSLVHDALYQIIRLGGLEQESAKPFADKLFLQMLKDEGVSWVTRHIAYQAVKIFGGGHLKPHHRRPVITCGGKK